MSTLTVRFRTGEARMLTDLPDDQVVTFADWVVNRRADTFTFTGGNATTVHRVEDVAAFTVDLDD